MFRLFAPKNTRDVPQTQEVTLGQLASLYVQAVRRTDAAQAVAALNDALVQQYDLSTVEQAKKLALTMIQPSPQPVHPQVLPPPPPVQQGLPIAPPEKLPESTRPAPPSKPAQPEPEPEPELVLDLNEVDIDPLNAVAIAIAAAYQAHGHQITPVKGKHQSGLRRNSYVFRKTLKDSFTALFSDRLKQEVLSHAGFDPTMQVIFKPLPSNEFALQINRPKQEWVPAPLLPNLPNFQAAESAWKSTDTQELKISRFVDCLRQGIGLGPSSPLRIPFMINADGELVWIDLSSGILLVGKPNSGKSNGLKVVLSLLFLALPPDLLQIPVMWDLKDGLTLAKFRNAPHIKRPALTRAVPDEVKSVFDKLRSTKEHRGVLMRELGAENIVEYNSMVPRSQWIPWSPIVIEELTVFYRSLGDLSDELLGEASREWRAAGMPLICTTQYASKDLGMGPSIRSNYGCIAAFSCSQPAAELVFGDDPAAVKIATRLTDGGDCLLKQAGEFFQGQVFYLGRSQNRDTLRDLLSVVQTADRSIVVGKSNSPREVESNPFSLELEPEEPEPAPELSISLPALADVSKASAEAQYPLASTDDPEWQAYQRIVQLKQSLLPKQPTIVQMIETAFGHEYDPPSKSHRSAYNKNKQRLDQILHRFSQGVDHAG